MKSYEGTKKALDSMSAEERRAFDKRMFADCRRFLREYGMEEEFEGADNDVLLRAGSCLLALNVLTNRGKVKPDSPELLALIHDLGEEWNRVKQGPAQFLYDIALFAESFLYLGPEYAEHLIPLWMAIHEGESGELRSLARLCLVQVAASHRLSVMDTGRKEADA